MWVEMSNKEKNKISDDIMIVQPEATTFLPLADVAILIDWSLK